MLSIFEHRLTVGLFTKLVFESVKYTDRSEMDINNSQKTQNQPKKTDNSDYFPVIFTCKTQGVTANLGFATVPTQIFSFLSSATTDQVISPSSTSQSGTPPCHSFEVQHAHVHGFLRMHESLHMLSSTFRGIDLRT